MNEHVAGSKIRHTVDFAPALMPGDTIVSADADPVALTATIADQTTSSVSVDVSGGSVGVPGEVTVTVTTAQGEIIPDTLCFEVIRKRGCN